MTTRTLTFEVPLGTKVIFKECCSPEWYIEISDTSVCASGRPKPHSWQPRELEVFRTLEDKYAYKLWNALKSASAKGRRELHFNFDRADFERTGIDRPRVVCHYFLLELCNDKSEACTMSNGRFFGMRFDVWNNGAFTTHFEW